MTCLFICGIEIINETKNRLVVFSELSESNFGSFSIIHTFKIHCFIFHLVKVLFENKQSTVHCCIG